MVSWVWVKVKELCSRRRRCFSPLARRLSRSHAALWPRASSFSLPRGDILNSDFAGPLPRARAAQLMGLKQQRRQRKRKHHLKTNVWEMVTILWLLLLLRILYCWQSTLQMDREKCRWSKYREREIHCCVFKDKTLNLGISRCHLANYVNELYESACRTCRTCRTCSTIIFPRSANQFIVFWRCRCLCRDPCLSSLMSNVRWLSRLWYFAYARMRVAFLRNFWCTTEFEAAFFTSGEIFNRRWTIW